MTAFALTCGCSAHFLDDNQNPTNASAAKLANVDSPGTLNALSDGLVVGTGVVVLVTGSAHTVVVDEGLHVAPVAKVGVNVTVAAGHVCVVAGA